MSSWIVLAVALASFACGQRAVAEVEPPPRFRGEVVRVKDGDTVVVRWERSDVEIRLWGIDAPEMAQPGGAAARDALRALAAGETVRVVGAANDRYGRRVAEVLLADGRSLNRQQVEAGHAWHYRDYAADDVTLAALEAWARDERRGLWRASNPQPPWEFRHAGRPERAPPSSGKAPGPGDVIGNVRSRRYHAPGCPSRGEVSAKNRVTFTSVAAAEAAGYRRAGNCPR